MTPFESPNYTQIPNDLLGEFDEGRATPGLLVDMGLAELKVTLFLCRMTFGFHRKQCRVSVRTIQDATGLSHQGTLDGLEAATKRGLVAGERSRGVTVWRVLTGLPSRPDQADPLCPVVYPVDQSGLPSRPPSIKEKERKGHTAEDGVPSSGDRVAKSKKATPPAVQAYRQNANRYPAKSWWDEVIRTVGEEPGELLRWGNVVRAWVGLGWSPVNVKGMLDCYRRGIMPGSGDDARAVRTEILVEGA